MSPARRAVTAIFALNGGLFGIWAARIPAFVDRFDLTPGGLGLLLLCIAGGAILAFPLAGRLSDRIGAAALSRALLPLYGLAFAALPLFPSVPALALGLALFGAAYGALDVAMNGWAAEVERTQGRPLMSSFHAAYSLGAGMGAGAGWAFAGWGAPLLLNFAGLALPLTVATMALTRIPWTSRLSVEAPAFAIPRGALALVGLVAFASAVGEGAMADWGAVALIEIHRATEARAALGYAVFSAAMVAMRLVADGIIARIGPVRAVRLSGISAAAGIGVLTLSPGLGAALPGFVLLGIGYAAIFPVALSRAAADPHMPSGQAIAAVATLGYGGMLIGPPVIGWIASDTGLAGGLGVVAILALLMSALAPAVRRA